MPRLIVTEGAAKGLERCRRFLSDKDPQVARRAAQAIERQFARLEKSPEVGRPFPDLPELRELIRAPDAEAREAAWGRLVARLTPLLLMPSALTVDNKLVTEVSRPTRPTPAGPIRTATSLTRSRLTT